MQEQILLHNSTPEQFTQTILEGVKSLLNEISTSKEENAYLTRKQVCELLQINLSTLWHWTKKGKLISYGIGNRVYYKSNEVNNAIKPLIS